MVSDNSYPEIGAAVRDLIALESEIGASETVSAEQRARLADITGRLKHAAAKPEPNANSAAPAPSRESGAGPKYPAVQVAIADLGGDLYAIMRRISYAMGDANLEDEKIAWFKEELKSSGDCVAVAKSWVTVTDS